VKKKKKKNMSAERYFGVALDYSPSSKYALKWAIENVVKEGDHLVLVVVHKEVLEGGQVHLWGKTGSPLVPYESLTDPSIQKAYQLKWDEEVLHSLKEAVTVKKLTVVAKVYWGDAKEKICDAVIEIPLDALIMGSRGFGTFKRTLLGSVSNHVLNSVPCPVTVVKLPPSLGF
jgi:nucleotide-binding universal stress UspA family protein